MKLYPVIFILFLVCSCVKDKPQEQIKASVNINSGNTVFVINEGLYNSGHGSVSLYDPSSNAVVEDYYYQQNSSYLGNIVQSITKYNNNYYIVNNNSSSITVVNASNFIKKTTINGFNSPRYVLPITYNKAYVSDLYANSIQIVDLNSNTISGSIPCHGWTEKMVLIYNIAFVTNYYSDYCYVINTTTDAITDSINVGKGGASIEIDNNSKIWILTNGDATNNQAGRLVRIDPVSLQIELNLTFGLSDNPNNLCINKTRDTLFYLNKGVCKFPSSSIQLTSAYIKPGFTYYGMGINPNDYTIYLSDALGFTQKSTVEIYDINGNFKTSFKAGIGANGFLFE